MIKKLLSLIIIVQSNFAIAQMDLSNMCGENASEKNGSSFFIISELCKVANIKNDFYLLPCTKISNCKAYFKNSKKLIYYNPEFIGQLRNFGDLGLGLTVDDINTKFTEWEAVAAFAHEISHHLCGHFPVENSKLSKYEMELQADEYAGYLLYRLNASLTQSQKLFYSKDFPVTQTVDYPARFDRLAAVKKGFENSEKQLIINIQSSIITYRKSGNLTEDENNKLAREYYNKALENHKNKNFSVVESLLIKSANLNFADAMYGLYDCYDTRNGYIKRDTIKAIYWLKKAAELGQAGAQCELAYRFYQGYGVPYSEKNAVYWYTKSAEQGNASAQWSLANNYREGGMGLEIDKNKAIELYYKASLQNHLDARYYLATLYKEEFDDSFDNIFGAEMKYFKESEKLLSNLAEKKYVDAFWTLGDLYLDYCFYLEKEIRLTNLNEGLKKELADAILNAENWYDKGIKNNSSVVNCYTGKGDLYKFKKQYKIALSYYEKALKVDSENEAAITRIRAIKVLMKYDY